MKHTLLLFFSLIAAGIFAQPVELTLIDSWDDPELPGSEIFDNTYNEIWGYARDGREYAFLGSTMGTHVFDVTEDGPLTELIFLEGESDGEHIIHRDYHDYGGYLYVVADEEIALDPSSLEIYDLTMLPESMPLVYSSRDLIHTAHNIFIDSAAAKLYSLSSKGGQTGYAGMKVFSLADPSNPVELGHYKKIGNIEFGHVHDAYVEDDIAFLNCGYDGLIIADFSKDEPELLSYFSINDYPQAGYNHSGWVSKDFSHYYFADETWGSSMKIVELNDLTDAEISGTFYAGTEALSIPHNQLVRGNLLYSSYYYDGLQIFDITNPETPAQVAYYNTSDYPVANQSYEGAWGVYPFLPSGKILVSDMQKGLFVFECFGENCQTINTELIDQPFRVDLFPNPSFDQIEIKAEAMIHGITMFTMQGLRVNSWKHIDAMNTSIDVSNIAGSSYLLQITTDQGSTTRQVQVLD